MIIETEGVKFDVDIRFDRDGRVDEMQIILEGDKNEQELSDVLREDVIDDLQMRAVHQAPDAPEYEPEDDMEVSNG